MKRFKNILLICDFDVKQQMAVERAISLARQNEAVLTVFTVLRELPADARMASISMSQQAFFKQVFDDYNEQLETLSTEIRQQGIEVKSKIVTGTPFLEIIRQVLREKHDLVILAAEGKKGLKERLFGSTSMHLMRKCPCPVWVVKSEKKSKYKRILAAVDTATEFLEPSRESLNPLTMNLASSLARMDNSELYVVQVWSMYYENYIKSRGLLEKSAILKLRKDTKQQYLEKLDSLMADIDLTGVITHKHLIRNDDAARAIIKLVKNKKINLLVIGTVCRTGLAGFFIGNTAEKVLSEVNCSVLTVKPEGFVTPVTLDVT